MCGRFVEADCIFLSPANGRNSVYCSITVSVEQSGWKEFFSQYEALMISRFNGRPHLGKWNTLSHQQLLNLYGQNINLFLQAKQTLDQKNKFGSKYLDDIFGI
jgi:hypothetical protein